MTKHKIPSKIRFNYLPKEGYMPFYVNGAVGGISGPKGEIILNFYLEKTTLPSTETFEVDSEGSLGKPVRKNATIPVVERHIQTGVVLHYQTAKEIHSWLGGLLEEYEENMPIIKKEDNED